MYVFTPQEIRMIHEERVGQLTKNAQHNNKRTSSPMNPFKRPLNVFKRSEISES